MSIGHTRPAEARPPQLEELPDGRKRLTRFRVLSQGARINDDLIQAWGTADAAPATSAEKTAGFAGLRLVDQKSAELGSVPGVNPQQPIWLEVYEEIPATAEVQVGSNTQIALEDGRTGIEANFLQFTAGTYAPGTVGSTTAPGDASAYLQKAEQTNDGTLRRIKRTYVYAGTIATEDESLQGGALLKKVIVSVKTVPSTPAGYTLVGSPVQSPNGLPVYTYSFFKGNGEVSRTTSSDNNDKLQRVVITHLTAASVGSQPTSDPLSGGVAIVTGQRDADGHRVWEVTWVKGDGEISRAVDYSQSSDQGTTGLTRTVIRHLTPSSTSADPTTLVGSVKVGEDKRDEAGHRVWTITYAKGTGQVVNDVTTKEGGKLKLYHRVKLGGAPTTPTATIAGTVTLVDSNVRSEAGFDVYDYTWAEGVGEISRETDTRLGGMLQKVTIRHLTAVAISSQPTSQPIAGAAITSEGRADQDGYRMWTVVWTKANTDDLVVNATELRNKGKLLIHRRAQLGSAPDAPTGTIGGVVDISYSTRLEDGYTVYEAMWAEGYGTITDDVQSRHQGKLKLYHKVALAAAPSAPAATIGGTVVLIADDSREESGVTLYDRTWAEGKGLIGKSRQTREGGLVVETWVSLGASYDASFMLPDGILIAKDYEEMEGATRWTVSCMQKHDGTTPTSGTAVAVERYVPFVYPGRAKYIAPTVTVGGGTATCHDVFLSPPAEAQIKATVTITYQTSNAVGALAYTLWNPSESATINAKFGAWFAAPRSKVEGLRGYRAVNSGSSGTAGASGYDTCVLGERVYASATWALALSGGPSDPGGSTWTLHADTELAFIGYDGTKYYRRTEITAAVAAQAALPV